MATTADIIIPVNDAGRPIERTVRSILTAHESSRIRIIIVCHEISAEDIRTALNGTGGPNLSVIEFSDGIRSPAGPFNRGLDEAASEYVAVMGSDDFLEPGAIDAWLRHVDHERPAAALARLRYQNGALLHNPLTRPRRSHNLDAVKDRVFYRTAPLGLLRRDVVDELGLRFTDGLRSGCDLEFGVRLWSSGQRIDYMRDAPSYVIGSDAQSRVTTSPASIEVAFEALNRLLDQPFLNRLEPMVRRALAIKLVRIHILGGILMRGRAAAWRDDDEIAHARSTLRRVLSLEDDVLTPFPRANRYVLDTLIDDQNGAAEVVDSVNRAAAASFFSRTISTTLPSIFGRESVLRRYALYALSR